MKRIIIPAVAAFGLAIAAPALAAQDHTATQTAQRDTDHDKNRDRNRDSDHNKDRERDRDRVHQPAPPPQHTAPRAPGGVTHEYHRTVPNPPPVMHEDHPVIHHETTRHRPPPVTTHERIERYNWNNYQQGHAPPRMRNAPRLDFHVWHRNFNAPRHFHREPYHRPSGWYYRRWAFGMVLPTFFWSRDYWISDYWNYDLPDPPYGYVWVRYGDDAVLVNVSSGYVLQVVYDLFD